MPDPDGGATAVEQAFDDQQTQSAGGQTGGQSQDAGDSLADPLSNADLGSDGSDDGGTPDDPNPLGLAAMSRAAQQQLGQFQAQGGDEAETIDASEPSDRANYAPLKANKVDEKYLRRAKAAKLVGKKDKHFSDASDELHAAKNQDLSAGIVKHRKMAVRTTEVLDEHHGFLQKYYALLEGGSAALEQQITTAKENLTQDSPQDALDKVLGMEAEKKEADARAADLDRWRTPVGTWAEQAHVASLKMGLFEQEVNAKKEAGTPIDHGTRQTFEEHKTTIDDLFNKRKQARMWQLKGDQSRKWAKEGSTHFSKLVHGRAQRWGRKAGSALGTMVTGALTGGMVGVEARRVQGGRQTKLGLQLAKHVDRFRNLKAECKVLKDEGTMGGPKAAMAYNVLKMLSEMWMPLIASISGSIALWATILAPATGGTSLAVAAAAAAVSLSTIALKTLVDIVMLLWSSIRGGVTKDHNARQHAAAKAETTTNVQKTVGDVLTVAAQGTLASVDGNMLSPDEAVKAQLDNLDPSSGFGTNSNPDLADAQFGSAGYTDNADWGAMQGVADAGDDVGKMVQYGNKGVIEAVKWKGRKQQGGGILAAKNKNAFIGKATTLTVGLGANDQKFQSSLTNMRGGSGLHGNSNLTFGLDGTQSLPQGDSQADLDLGNFSDVELQHSDTNEPDELAMEPTKAEQLTLSDAELPVMRARLKSLQGGGKKITGKFSAMADKADKAIQKASSGDEIDAAEATDNQAVGSNLKIIVTSLDEAFNSGSFGGA